MVYCSEVLEEEPSKAAVPSLTFEALQFAHESWFPSIQFCQLVLRLWSGLPPPSALAVPHSETNTERPASIACCALAPSQGVFQDVCPLQQWELA